MPCKSWGLQAQKTCPGSFDASGNLVPVCQGCYAVGGFYGKPSVVALRASNKKIWKQPDWIDNMVEALTGEKYFRWFDSGDIYCPGLARKIFAVCQNTPWVSHFIPTRSHKIRRIRIILDRIAALPNIRIRYSSDNLHGNYDSTLHGSAVAPLILLSKDDERVCPAHTRNFQCGDCRRCWDKEVPIVIYPSHGQAMRRVMRRSLTKDLFA